MPPALTLELPGLTLLRPVGSGSFGEVWLARTVTGQFRAVKIVWLRRAGGTEPDARLEELGDRVFRGVQEYLRRIPPGSSAGLAVLHVDRDPAGRCFHYVMELADDAVTGREIVPDRYEALTLGELRRRQTGGHVPAGETIRLGVKLADGLAALHRAGLVHRDLKPSNIVFIGGEPRLADIDLVRPSEASLSLGGALGYAPPEGPGRPPADVFSLARTLYVTTTGLSAGEFPRLPENWDRRPDADELRRLNTVLLRACERDPARRHPDGGALRDELMRVAAGEDLERARRLRRLARVATVTAAVMMPLALAALFVAWQLSQKEAAKTFALYQANLSETASNLERQSLGNARRALTNAAASPQHGLEVELLRRQTVGDPALVLPPLKASVDQLILSDDGKLLAAVTADYQAHVFTLPDARLIARLTNVIRLAGFLPGGTNLVGMFGRKNEFDDRALQIWDLPSGKVRPNRLAGRWVAARVLSDGKTVLAQSRTRLGRLVRWQPLGETGTAVELDWHPALPRDDHLPGPLAEMDATGTRLLYRQSTGLNDTYVSQLYFAEPGRSVPAVQKLPGRDIQAIALSADGRCAAYVEPSVGELVTGTYADGFRPTATNRLPEIGALAYAPDGGRLASGGNGDQLIRLHDGTSLAVTRVLAGHRDGLTALAWSGDGTLLASGDSGGEVRLWRMGEDNPEEQEVWPGFKVGVGPVQLVASADESLVAATASTHSVVVLDALHLRPQQRIEGITIPLLLSAGRRELWALGPGGQLVLTRLGEPKPVWQTNAFDGPVETAFGQASPDGRRLVLYSGEQVAIWSLEQFPPRRLPCKARHGDNIRDLAISGDSRRAVTLAAGDAPLLLDLNDASAISISGLTGTAGEAEEFFSACFPPGLGGCVLGGKGGKFVRVDTAKPARHTLLPSDLTADYQLVATPEGDRILTGGAGGRLGVGRASDGARLVWFTHRSLAAQPGEHTLKRLLYLPRQQRLLSLTEDGLLVRW